MFYVPNRLVWSAEDEITGSWEDFITGQTTADEQHTGPVGDEEPP